MRSSLWTAPQTAPRRTAASPSGVNDLARNLAAAVPQPTSLGWGFRLSASVGDIVQERGRLWVRACALPPKPSPKKTHRRRQQLDWGRCGACLLLPSLSKHSVDGGATDLERVALAVARPYGCGSAGWCGAEVALKRIGILDGAGVPHNFETGQELDIARRTAVILQGDTIGFIGRRVFRPVLLQRIPRRGLVGKTGFLVTPGDDGAARGSLATRPNLESGRATGAPTASLEPSVVFLALLRWCRFGRQLFVDDIRGKVIQSWLSMPDRCLTCDLARGRGETGPKRWDFLSESAVSRQRQDRNTNSW
jgi:hypothetical protein